MYRSRILLLALSAPPTAALCLIGATACITNLSTLPPGLLALSEMISALACSAGALICLWYAASALTALVASRPPSPRHRAQRRAITLLGRYGAPGLRGLASGALIAALATGTAQAAPAGDDLSWSPAPPGTTHEQVAPDPPASGPTDTLAPETTHQADTNPHADDGQEAASSPAAGGVTNPSQPATTPGTAATDAALPSRGVAVPDDLGTAVTSPGAPRESGALSDTPGSSVSRPSSPAQPRSRLTSARRDSSVRPPVRARYSSAPTSRRPGELPPRPRRRGLPASASTAPAGLAPGASTSSADAAPRVTATAGRARTHTVVAGECLWSITRDLITAPGADAPDAQTVAASWPLLYLHNQAAIGDDPSLIRPGTELAVPEDLAS